MKRNLISYGFLALALLTSCAKHRPVDEITVKNDWVPKDVLLQKNNDPSVWLSRVTVVKNTTNGGGFLFVGLQSTTKMGHFEFTAIPNSDKGHLKFINDVDVFKKDSPNVARQLITQWSITHKDVKLAESDGNVTNKEEVDSEKDPKARRYFEIDFANYDISEGAMFPFYIDAQELLCYAKKASYLVEDSLEVSEDYISFVVGADYQLNTLCNSDIRRNIRDDFTRTVHFRYSFRRAEKSDYTPFVYSNENDPALKKYGFFTRVRETLDENNRYKAQVMMKRWDPNKEHHFYFAKGFAEEWKWVYADPEMGVFARTNQIMEKIGAKARFYIHENTWGDGKEKEVGDVRYSFINFIDAVDPNSPFGYGPSDGHPMTGEIISANSTIWTGFLKYYLKRIDETLVRKETKFDQSSLFSSMKTTLEEADPTQWTRPIEKDSLTGNAFTKLLTKLTYGYPAWSTFTNTPKAPLMGNDLSHRVAEIAPAHSVGKYLDVLDNISKVADEYEKKVLNPIRYQEAQTIYPMEEILVNGKNMLENGVSMQDAMNAIVYNVALHEFGHNMGLRHNFYGSIDIHNHPAGGHSASIMDYLDLTDEITSAFNWAPYDVAALSYAYGDDQVQKAQMQKNYLFCTDEHRPLNALCNHWDRGNSPSEVLMSMIERYEDLYHIRNYRYDRAYWDNSGYDSSIFSTMLDIKRFLPMWETAFTSRTVRDELTKMGELGRLDVEDVTKEVSLQMKETQKLSVGFFNSVLQQASSDRPWRTQYNTWTGELERVGIISDKIYAMFFLGGDDTFVYNPNKVLASESYLVHKGEPELKKIFDKVYENVVTQRVDMEPWFIGFGRALFAAQAVNPYNRDDVTLINKIRIARMTKDQLINGLGLKPEYVATLDTDITQVPNGFGYFHANETVGIVKLDDSDEKEGDFLLASETRNAYAFTIVKNLTQNEKRFDDSSSVQAKLDMLELYNLYRSARGYTAQ